MDPRIDMVKQKQKQHEGKGDSSGEYLEVDAARKSHPAVSGLRRQPGLSPKTSRRKLETTLHKRSTQVTSENGCACWGPHRGDFGLSCSLRRAGLGGVPGPKQHPFPVSYLTFSGAL